MSNENYNWEIETRHILTRQDRSSRVDGGITGKQRNGWTRKECFCRQLFFPVRPFRRIPIN